MKKDNVQFIMLILVGLAFAYFLLAISYGITWTF